MYGRLSSLNIDGSNIQFLTNGWPYQAYAPKWAPSGDKILYVIEFTDDSPESVINISKPSDGSDDQLFDGNFLGYKYRNKQAWSPDGTKILAGRP
jgi:Tol biopolymer transport system component